MNYDVIIVGAGIIGLTIAREILNRSPKTSLLIIEKEKKSGLHASGRNSGVLHTGIYYPANTLKAKFCKQGADSLYQFAKSKSIPVRKDGKLIIASNEKETSALNQLLSNAKNNNINAVLVNKEEINEIEPLACSEFGGIYCRDTGVIDNKKILECLCDEVLVMGGTIVFGEQVFNIDDEEGILRTNKSKFQYGKLINSAGAHADTVAKLVGVGHEYSLVPFKGVYYKLKDEFASQIRGSIYPVPDPKLPFLGIHFTRSIYNDVYIGPSALPALGRENYHFLEGVHLTECLSILKNMMGLYFTNTQNFREQAYKEMRHIQRSGFYNSAVKLVKNINIDMIQKTEKVGIRPQLINVKEKKLEMDFLMKEGKKSIHLLNSISPAFTSSFAVAEYIVDEMKI